MNEQQRKTLSVRVHVKRDVAIENLLTALAKDPLFANVTTSELIAVIVDLATIDNETRADMLSYFENERNKQPGNR